MKNFNTCFGCQEYSELANVRTLWTVADFNSNGTFDFVRSISNYKEFIISLTLNSQLRLTVLICDDTQLKSTNGVFPDFMTSDGRVYCQLKAISDTQYTVSSLTGLASVGAYAGIRIMAR